MAFGKLLVVDDSRTIRLQLQQVLIEAGFDVVLASNGDEGLRRAVDERPDLMILDIQMPGIDGYALCQSLKQMGEPWDRLPIVFVTSLESHALDLLGGQMGAYLKKPVCRHALLATVSRTLKAVAASTSVC